MAENPQNAFEALDVARRIEEAIRRESTGPADFFTLQRVEEARIREGHWSAVNFLSPFLVKAYRTLREETPAAIPMVPLSQLAAIGPAGQRIRDAYTRSQMPTLSGRRALWFHKTDVSQSMQGETDVYIEPKKSKRHLADSYWEQRGHVLLPHRLHSIWQGRFLLFFLKLPWVQYGLPVVPTNRKSQRPSVSTSTQRRVSCHCWEKGITASPPTPSFSLDTLRSLLVPDFTALDEARLKMMRDCFQRLKRESLLSFPRMTEDPVRREIDDCVAETLGLDKDWLERVRAALCREPAITGSSVTA